jgi:hypothetical protein
MKSFTIENENNNITVHFSAKEAETVSNADHFGTEAALIRLAANWPAARLVEIWNSLPGAGPIRKFKDRKTAARRIWKAIQSLGSPPEGEPVAATKPLVQPGTGPATSSATRVKKAPDAMKNGIRKGSTAEVILGLLQRPGGSTQEAIMEATNWQAHSVRGFISGTLSKKMGLAVVSAKGENGERTYSVHA